MAMPTTLRRRFRPRGLILTAMIVLVGAMIWRSQRSRNEADAALAADWVRSTVLAAQADRGREFEVAGTQPVVAGALASWVRSTVPEGRAVEAKVSVTALGAGPFGAREGDATHRAAIDLLGSRAEADLHWPQDGRAIVAWRVVEPSR